MKYLVVHRSKLLVNLKEMYTYISKNKHRNLSEKGI